MLDLFFYSAKMHQISTKMTENENICLAFYWVISCSMSEHGSLLFQEFVNNALKLEPCFKAEKSTKMTIYVTG